MEIVTKAAEMLAKSGEITLASINENGYPRICVLSKIKSEGIKKSGLSIIIREGLTTPITVYSNLKPGKRPCGLIMNF